MFWLRLWKSCFLRRYLDENFKQFIEDSNFAVKDPFEVVKKINQWRLIKREKMCIKSEMEEFFSNHASELAQFSSSDEYENIPGPPFTTKLKKIENLFQWFLQHFNNGGLLHQMDVDRVKIEAVLKSKIG